MARNRVNTFNSESFKNSIGQTLNPGDKVVAITTGYNHRVNTFTGTFDGVYKNGRGQITGTRVANVPVTWNERQFADDGEHEETRIVFNREAMRYDYIPTGRRFNLIKNTRYRKSTLQRNRVYKIETPLA